MAHIMTLYYTNISMNHGLNSSVFLCNSIESLFGEELTTCVEQCKRNENIHPFCRYFSSIYPMVDMPTDMNRIKT
jgi:hypothetical protein